jgi:acyl-CoA thioesterase-1
MLRGLVILFASMFFQSAQSATLLVWGDSLSAAYGIAQESAWPTLLEHKLTREGYRYQVVNASISGETTAGGLARLPEALSRNKPSIILIELGANDGLRSLPLPAMRANLASMIEKSQAAGARVVLIGMRMPPNFGPVFDEKFRAIYTELAKKYNTGLAPFMMEGFAQKADLFQGDGIHPLAPAQPMILNNIWPALKPLLGKPSAR